MNEPHNQIARFQGLRRFLRWFVPGLGVKRWFLLALTGMTLLGLGLAILLLDLYRTDSTNQILLTFLSYASLRFLPRWARVLVFGGLSAFALLFLSVLLDRINAARTDPYREVEK